MCFFSTSTMVSTSSENECEMRPLTPLSSTLLSPTPSPLPSPNNDTCVSNIQSRIKKVTSENVNKESRSREKDRKKVTEEKDEVEKSFLNLSSVLPHHFLEKQQMDEDDFFGNIIAHQLRKIQEPKKTELKGKLMKTLYEL